MGLDDDVVSSYWVLVVVDCCAVGAIVSFASVGISVGEIAGECVLSFLKGDREGVAVGTDNVGLDVGLDDGGKVHDSSKNDTCPTGSSQNLGFESVLTDKQFPVPWSYEQPSTATHAWQLLVFKVQTSQHPVALFSHVYSLGKH